MRVGTARRQGSQRTPRGAGNNPAERRHTHRNEKCAGVAPKRVARRPGRAKLPAPDEHPPPAPQETPQPQPTTHPTHSLPTPNPEPARHHQPATATSPPPPTPLPHRLPSGPGHPASGALVPADAAHRYREHTHRGR